MNADGREYQCPDAAPGFGTASVTNLINHLNFLFAFIRVYLRVRFVPFCVSS